MSAGRYVACWIVRIRSAVRPAGWICDDFAVSLAGLAGRTRGSAAALSQAAPWPGCQLALWSFGHEWSLDKLTGAQK